MYRWMYKNGCKRRRRSISLLQRMFCCVSRYQPLKQCDDSYMEDSIVLDVNQFRCTTQCLDEDWPSLLTETKRRSPVRDRDLFLVSEHIGEGWETVGIRLGMSSVGVNRCKMADTSCQMQIFTMLEKWRKKNGRQATVEVLVSVLQECLYHCTLDMFAIVDILQKSVQ